MKIVIEILVSVILILTGYIAVCCYLKKLKYNQLTLNVVAVKSKNKIVYLALAVIAFSLVITLFQTIYQAETLIHQLKLLVLIAVIFPIAAIDYRLKKIPNGFLIAALVARTIFYVVEFIIYKSQAFNILKDNLLGTTIIGVFFLLILLLFKNSIGMGDVKLFAVMGLYQGLWGAINSVFFSLVASFFLSIALLIFKKKNRKDAIPFGPSILVGTMIAICISGI